MQKIVNSNHGLVLFNPLIGTLSGATTPGQSGPGSDCSKEVLCISQSFSITGTSPSDCLVSFPGHSLGGFDPSVEKQLVYSTTPAEWARCKREYELEINYQFMSTNTYILTFNTLKPSPKHKIAI